MNMDLNPTVNTPKHNIEDPIDYVDATLHGSRYMTNVFSIAAVQTFLVKIISESCGTVIEMSRDRTVSLSLMQKMHSIC